MYLKKLFIVFQCWAMGLEIADHNLLMRMLEMAL